MPVNRTRGAVAVMVVVLVLFAGCSKPPERSDTLRPARVMTVRPATGEDVMLFAGEVRPRHEIDLSFRIGGKLLERTVDLGAQIRRGQTLARLDPQDARLSAAAAAAQVAAAAADLALAQAELDRSRRLLDQKFISQAAYDNKVGAYQVALARLDSARAQSAVSANQAGYATLVADSAGVITAVLAEAGQVVAAGQAVMKLARIEQREVLISVAESQASGLRVGAPARISLWSQPQKIYQGRIREIAPAADGLTRTFLVKVSVVDADEGLRWGMTANVGIVGLRGGAPATGAIIVPLTALNQQGRQAYVWVVGPGNAVLLQPVTVAQFLVQGAVIAGGLQGGETIVVAGVHKLTAGEIVRPLPEPAPAAAPAIALPAGPGAPPTAGPAPAPPGR